MSGSEAPEDSSREPEEGLSFHLLSSMTFAPERRVVRGPDVQGRSHGVKKMVIFWIIE